MSAKRRRFVEGTTVLVDRPDFYDKESAIKGILSFFGDAQRAGDLDTRALDLLTEFPSLLIIDDIDTIEGKSEDAIQFLLMTVPERSKSRVLITSRRALFGMANLTTQVRGLEPHDAEEFIKSRCALMGISAAPVLGFKDRVLEVTDASPLFIEDLLRLAQSGIGIERAIGLWSERRGADARKYAIQREFDQLDDDAKYVLLALTIQGSCTAAEICQGLDWPADRLVDAMQQLRKMFLMPTPTTSGSSEQLALNRNIQSLVRDVFSGSEAFRRTARIMRAASGALKTKRSEDERAATVLRRAGLLVKQGREEEAEEEVQASVNEFPGRSDLLAGLAWVQKKRRDYASARMNFRRAHELGCSQRDAYWHWSDMEAVNQEWKSSAEAAELGIRKFGSEQGLLFRLGYAIHRQGRELILEGEDGEKLCRRAQDILEQARQLQDAEYRNFSLKHQIYRAIALNLEALGDGASLARHFALWYRECPDDPHLESEYERLRLQFPQYLSAH
jgi:hypothetical protein